MFMYICTYVGTFNKIMSSCISHITAHHFILRIFQGYKNTQQKETYIKCNLYVWQNLCKEIQNIIFHIKVFATRGFLKRIYKQNPFFYLQGRKLRQY